MSEILKEFLALGGFMPKPKRAAKHKSHLHFVAAQNKKDKEFDKKAKQDKEKARTRRAKLLKDDK